MNGSFQNLDIDQAIRSDEAISRRVSEATRLLQSVVGKSAGRIQVKWTLPRPGVRI